MQATFREEMVIEQEAPYRSGQFLHKDATVICLEYKSKSYLTELQIMAAKFTGKLPNIHLI